MGDSVDKQTGVFYLQLFDVVGRLFYSGFYFFAFGDCAKGAQEIVKNMKEFFIHPL